MRILFTSGLGILPEQRIDRWRMVSRLYADLGRSLRTLAHQTYYCVHPQARHDALPPEMTWLAEDHAHFETVLDSFRPDFVFCWNGSSPGDRITATLSGAAGANMMYSEQGWFPQNRTLYFDRSGTNARCGTRHRRFPPLTDARRARFLAARGRYIEASGAKGVFDTASFRIAAPDLSKPVFVPLQDERDLNIVQDSPFRTMDAFVGFLSRSWPGVRFRVRPHPKFPEPRLGDYDNVTRDRPDHPMFDSLADCGLVVGINSTTLLESALLGKPVIALGEGLATGTGLLHDATPENLPNPEACEIDSGVAEAVLAALLERQMFRDTLADPAVILGSPVFGEMRGHMMKRPLQAWL